MPSYTTSLRLVQPATGEYSGTWGTQVNTGITALVDASVAGIANIAVGSTNYTLSTANGASDEARAAVLNLTAGSGVGARNVICPAVSKLYFVSNSTGFAQTVKTAAGTGISVPNGETMVVRCDGTNVVAALTSLPGFTAALGKLLTVNNTITFSGTDGTLFTLPAANTTLVGTDSTQTLTNKRVNSRSVAAGATSGTLTINGDTTDVYVAEGLTGGITLAQPSGTPVNGQRLMIRLKDNGTARGITWTVTSGAFRAMGITLPTTTTASKTTYVGCVYNSADSFWDALATVTQA